MPNENKTNEVKVENKNEVVKVELTKKEKFFAVAKIAVPSFIAGGLVTGGIFWLLGKDVALEAGKAVVENI